MDTDTALTVLTFLGIVLFGTLAYLFKPPTLRERCLLLASEHYETIGDEGVIATAICYEFYVLTGENIHSDPQPE